MLDNQHCHAPVLGQAANHHSQFFALGGAQASGRLIEQQHARVHRNRPGNREQPVLSV